MLLGIMLPVFMPALDKWSKRYFIALFSLMFLCSVICFSARVFRYDPSKAAAERILYLLEGIFLVTPVFMPTLFLLHYSGETIGKSVLFRLVTAILCVYFAALAAAQFTDAVCYVTPGDPFFRGRWWDVGQNHDPAIGRIRQRSENDHN